MEFYVLKFDVAALTGAPAPAGYRGIRYMADMSVWFIPRGAQPAVQHLRRFVRVMADGTYGISVVWPEYYMRKIEPEDFKKPRIKEIMMAVAKKAL